MHVVTYGVLLARAGAEPGGMGSSQRRARGGRARGRRARRGERAGAGVTAVTNAVLRFGLIVCLLHDEIPDRNPQGGNVALCRRRHARRKRTRETAASGEETREAGAMRESEAGGDDVRGEGGRGSRQGEANGAATAQGPCGGRCEATEDVPVIDYSTQ